MNKKNPNLTVTMSTTQDDMNQFIRRKMDKVQQDFIAIQNRPREPSENIRQILSYLNNKDPNSSAVDIAIGVDNYLYLNMLTKSFCDTEEELEAQIKHNRGYVRALDFTQEYNLVAGGGYFSAGQALELARAIMSEFYGYSALTCGP